MADPLVIARFQTALDMWGTGVALRRQSIRRTHPDATDVEVEARVNQWLQERPGAESGDGPRPAP
ncbi:MAG: hypothetical protein ABI039_08685 [Vicinamibacterales bacterium]